MNDLADRRRPAEVSKLQDQLAELEDAFISSQKKALEHIDRRFDECRTNIEFEVERGKEGFRRHKELIEQNKERIDKLEAGNHLQQTFNSNQIIHNKHAEIQFSNIGASLDTIIQSIKISNELSEQGRIAIKESQSKKSTAAVIAPYFASVIIVMAVVSAATGHIDLFYAWINKARFWAP